MNFLSFDAEKYKNVPLVCLGDGNSSVPLTIQCYNQTALLSPFHRHKIVQMNYVLYGSIGHKINDSVCTLVKGDVFIVPPYVPHQLIPCGQPYQIIEIEFENDFLYGPPESDFSLLQSNHAIFDITYLEPFLVTESEVKPRLSISGIEQQKVELLLQEMLEEYQVRSDGFLMALKANLLKILVLIGRHHERQMSDNICGQSFSRYRESLMKSIQYMDANFASPLTLEEITRIAMLSQSYFSYLFKILTGKTFTEYLKAKRVQEAVCLLCESNANIADICFSCGFNSITNFDRCFKSVMGISPSRYRQAFRKSIKQEK